MNAPRWSRHLPRLLTVVGVLAICLGAESKSCTFLSTTGSGGSGSMSFVVHLQLQDINGDVTDTFERGEQINLVMTIRNRLDTSASVEFPTARQSDFVVVQENSSTVVWKWSDLRTFTPVQTRLDFDAGETKTITVSWNQVGTDNLQVIPGTYEARGVLVFSSFDTDPLQENQLASTLERFTVN
jgi:hypothetical protein